MLCFFKWFVCRVSPKSLLKRRVRSHVVRGEIKICTLLCRQAHFEVEMYKIRQVRSSFWSSDVEKLHGAVAKSTFWSENVQNASGSVLEVLMSKNCTLLLAKILKWKCTKHFRFSFGALFEVLMLHAAVARSTFPSQNVKNWWSRSTFWSSDVEKLHAAVARSTFVRENVQNTSAADSFLKFWCRNIAWTCGEKHICQSRCAKYLCFGAFSNSDAKQLVR